MDFPSKVFGRCEQTGHLGPDYSTVSHPDAEVVRGDAGTGYPLVPYRGKYMCKPCMRRLESERQSILSAKKHHREEAFRAKAGFQRL
jgi:hypothetical protein